MNINVCKTVNLVYNVFAVEKRRLLGFAYFGRLEPGQASFFRKNRKSIGTGCEASLSVLP